MPFVKPKAPPKNIVAPVKESAKSNLGVYRFMPSIKHEYLPEQIEDIEDEYQTMIACLHRSRMLRLAGHIRYLRRLLKDNKIPYHEDKVYMDEEDKYFYTKVSRWGDG